MAYLYLRFRRFCAFITGIVFFISGTVKLLDPVGAGLVMKEYFDFLHLSFMAPAAKFSGFLIAFSEAIIGAALATGVWRKVTYIAAASMQGFFTLLTLLLVIFNPEMDCGCFGEVIHLTHIQTFIKNLVLCALLAMAVLPVRNLGRPVKKKYISFAIVSLSSAVFGIYSWMYIPFMDFTDFKPAATLHAADAYSETGEDMYESVFVYEKDGIQKEFTLEELPDSTWTFIQTHTTLRNEGAEAGVDLSFYDAGENYRDSLATDGNVMMISVYDADMKAGRWKDIAEFMHDAESAGFTPLLLVSATAEKMDSILEDMDQEYAGYIESILYYSDYKTLIAMNRSNGGATWFRDGYLIRKWAKRALPSVEDLKLTAEGDATEIIIEGSTEGSLLFQGYLLYVFAVMLLM